MKKKIKVKTLDGTPFLISQQEQVGKGNFGKVVRAYKKDEPHLQLVAKIIPIIPQNKQSIISQLKILKQIPQHQNLVNCLKMQISTQHNFYLIMEYCNGGTFQKYIHQNQNCSQEIIWRFFREFSKGYRVLYDCHLVHRDIKPENILIHNGKFKIADFGLSRKVNHHNLTQNLSIKGTPLYIAPELQSQSAGNSKIDVFSFGIVLYRLCFNGKHPFYSQQKVFHSIQQYFQFVAVTPLKFPKYPKRSQPLVQLLSKMLQKDPMKRIGWKQIFQLPQLKQKNELKNTQQKLQFSQLRSSIIEIGRSSASLSVISQPFNYRNEVGAQMERLIQFTQYLPNFEIRGLEIFVTRSKVIIELIKHLNGFLRFLKQQKKVKLNKIIQEIIMEGNKYIYRSLGKIIEIIGKYETQIPKSLPNKLVEQLQKQQVEYQQYLEQHLIGTNKLREQSCELEHLKYENLLYDYLTEFPQWKAATKEKLKIPTALMIDLYDGLLKLGSMISFNANGRIQVIQIQLQDAELDKIDYQNLGTYEHYLDAINQITLQDVEKGLRSMGLLIQ